MGYRIFADQQMLIVYQIVYYNAMVLAKLSYLFFYLRIFVTEAFRLAAWICMGCALSYWLGSMLQIFLICQPFAKNWDPTLEGHCASQNVAFSTIGAFNLVTDLLIMLLPVHFIRKLQMSPATKLGLYMIFGLGFLYVISFFTLRLALTKQHLGNHHNPHPRPHHRRLYRSPILHDLGCILECD